MLLFLCSNINLFWFTKLVFTEEEEDLETLKEELEWIKSHECPRCGLIYDMSCVCQQEVELDMDEIPPGGIFNYGSDRPYLKRAKVSLLMSSMYIFLKK